MAIESSTGEFLGDGGWWRRGELLGEGSYGAVFVANRKSSVGSSSSSIATQFSTKIPNKMMAVKSAQNSCAETLRLERRIMSSFSGCSSIVQCFGTEITRKRDGTMIFNLLLEYCSGGTLAQRIEETGSRGIPELEVRRHTRSIVEALVIIHKADYVHCDLKPENILLDEFLQAKICDFGLAKKVNQDRQRRRTDRTWNGTPWFLAPEAIRNAMQEPPTDIWSLGIMVLEMLTGRPAWDLDQGSGSEAEKVIRQIMKPNGMPKIPANLSPEAKNFLHSCLKRMPKNRPTAEALLRHPFISKIRVGPRSQPQNIQRSCIQPSSLLNPGLIPKVIIRF